MKAVILAGGKGTRLEPYTTVFPKPLVPIGHRPIVDIIVRQLAYYGFRDIVLNVGYLSELIRAYFQNGINDLENVKLSYHKESEPIGTAGSLRTIQGMSETFLVMNGDILTTMDYTKLITYHREKGGILTISMHKKRNKVGLGVIETDNNDCLTSYEEKPETEYKVSMGVYVYEPEALEYIDPDVYLDFPHLVTRLLESGEKVVGYPCSDFWLDIGNHEDYVKAQKVFEESKYDFLPKDVF
jgi:NDP-sugar pyrophosphorylase family protein|tara:strand:+ start:1600 stop:2322 length:723 start_codon:yes stop_codon:yes gene_type:complete